MCRPIFANDDLGDVEFIVALILVASFFSVYVPCIPHNSICKLIDISHELTSVLNSNSNSNHKQIGWHRQTLLLYIDHVSIVIVLLELSFFFSSSFLTPSS